MIKWNFKRSRIFRWTGLYCELCFMLDRVIVTCIYLFFFISSHAYLLPSERSESTGRDCVLLKDTLAEYAIVGIKVSISTLKHSRTKPRSHARALCISWWYRALYLRGVIFTKLFKGWLNTLLKKMVCSFLCALLNMRLEEYISNRQPTVA